MNYYKRKQLASFVYKYGDHGLLIEKIQTYDVNNKDRVDTTRFDYEFDEQERVISKSKSYGQWVVLENFQNFNNKGFPTRIITCLIHEFNFEEFSGMRCEAVVNYREQLIT